MRRRPGRPLLPNYKAIIKFCVGQLAITDSSYRHIRAFLDLPSTRSTLGVDDAVPANFSSCSESVSYAFGSRGDILQPSTADHVGALLDRGVRVLIYVGEYDWICNWVGNERFTLALDWAGKEEFGKQELREWTVNGTTAGRTRKAKNFTFATIKEAGHMVSL